MRKKIASTGEKLNSRLLCGFVRDFLQSRSTTRALELELASMEKQIQGSNSTDPESPDSDHEYPSDDDSRSHPANKTKSSLPAYTRLSITERQIRRWLHKLGYSWKDIRKGVYIDGHEREDVVQYRKGFVRRMSEIYKSGLLVKVDTETGELLMPKDVPVGKKPIMLFTHDESTFNANDGIRSAWLLKGHQILRPKARGKGIMASDINTQVGRLVVPAHISDAEMAAAGVFRRDAVELLEYGKDNWWDSEKMCKHILDVVEPMARLVYPGCNFVFLFDNATNHSCFAENALNVTDMNLNPGGKQPVMREGFDHTRHLPQNMNDGNGIPKGLKQVLQERRLWREDLTTDCSLLSCIDCRAIERNRAANLRRHPRKKCNDCQAISTTNKVLRCTTCAEFLSNTPLPPRKCTVCSTLKKHRSDATIKGCCARQILRLQTDFLDQQGILQETLTIRGHEVLFYPKFHCELNWIEYYWGASKRYARENCEYTLEGLRENVPLALLSVPSLLIQKFFLRTMRMVEAYLGDCQYGSKEYEEIVYKSHRRVRENVKGGLGEVNTGLGGTEGV